MKPQDRDRDRRPDTSTSTETEPTRSPSLAFAREHGVIVACDVPDLKALRELVAATCRVEGVVGYKLGKILGYRYGILRVLEEIRAQTTKPVIFDGQKEGADVEATAQAAVETYKACGVDALIVFPFAGPRTQAALIRACHRLGITPIGGFELSSSPFYADEEGDLSDLIPEGLGRTGRGYIAPDSGERALALFAAFGVRHYIGPATKPDVVRRMRAQLEGYGIRPVFALPGIGRQGGDLHAAFEAAGATDGRPAYAIVGSAIYKADDPGEAAAAYAREAQAFDETKQTDRMKQEGRGRAKAKIQAQQAREICRKLWAIGAVALDFERGFTLADGSLSPIYFDLRLLFGHPPERELILKRMLGVCQEIGEAAIEVVAGGETAGIPLGAWLADRLHKPFIYVRKRPKGYGRAAHAQIEGLKDLQGKRVTLVEDLITGGSSKRAFLEGLRRAGAQVEHCLVVFDRQQGGGDWLAGEGVRLHSLVTMEDFLHFLEGEDPSRAEALRTYWNRNRREKDRDKG